jgi:hypothetical protein
MYKLIVVPLFLISGLSWAQISNVTVGIGNEIIRTKKYEDISGSPYLYPTWTAGTVTSRDGTVYNNKMIKYDSYKNCIELNQDGQVLELNASFYPKFTLDYVDPTTNKILHHNFVTGLPLPGVDKSTYVELLYNGKHIFAKKIKTDFIEENTTNYGTSVVTKVFQTRQFYFLSTSDVSVAREIKLNTKSVEEFFGQVGVKLITNGQRAKIKSEADLINILRTLE